MKRFLSGLIVLLLSSAGSLSGGSTPNNMTVTAFTDSWQVGCPAGVPAGVTTRFFIAANGDDTNTGTDEQHPWRFAPGMHNCSKNCSSAGNAPCAGRGYILRGGDTWHYGNSGASPYVGITPSGNGSNCDAGNSCGWSIGGPRNPWTGTAANPIYFGVDQTWFSGASWTWPTMDGDNPLSSSGVASCTHDDSTFSFLQSWTGSTNFIVDNFEFTGLCWSGANTSAVYVSIKNHFGGATTNRVVEDNYFHGWTHVTFSCSAGPSGNCEAGLGAIDGPSDKTAGIGDRISHNVFDGTDTDQQSYSDILFGAYIVEYNVFTHMAQGAILNNNHSFHDNLMDTIYGLSDGQAHGNGIEMNTEFSAVNVFYNNVFKNFFPGGAGCGNVVVWRSPQTTDYAFNNLTYGQPASCRNSNFWDLVTSNHGGADGWTDNEFNNTWVLSAKGPFTNSTMNGTATVNMFNTHCISPNGGTSASCQTINGTVNYQTNVVQTTTAATNQGYTAEETFAYSPTSGGRTIATGTNKQSLCSALTRSSDAVLQVAGTACQSGTGYACAYNSTNHTVSCPALTLVVRPSSAAWDVGAYEFSSTGQAAPKFVP